MKFLKRSLTLIIIGMFGLSFTFLDDWILFEGIGFKMLFPERPAAQTETIKSAVGELKMHIYMYEVADTARDENLLYGLFQTDYPDSLISSYKKDNLESFFRNSIDGAAKNGRGKILSETIIELDGYPGREVRIDFQQGLAVIRMRFYLVKNRLFILQTITITKKDFNKSIDRFMNSFKLVWD